LDYSLVVRKNILDFTVGKVSDHTGEALITTELISGYDRITFFASSTDNHAILFFISSLR
jgi:hypothetical protein